jgi:Raf kinase inhibitor-like YbhB/YbcL family protein
MRIKWLLAYTAATLALSSGADARIRAYDTQALAIDRVISPAVQPLTVASPAAEGDKPMAQLYTAFGKDISPPVTWSDAPPGVLSYVVIMQDADAPGGPATHWIAYNIPGTAQGLSRGMRNRSEPTSPAGTMQGINYAGGVGYIGPKPPSGDKPHHYHIQVFALDRTIKVKPKSDLDQVLMGMDGRVLAEGEVVAVFAAPPPNAKAADAKAAGG